MTSVEMPWRVYEHLLAGFVVKWAHWQLATLKRYGGYSPGDVVHPGDPFGTVLAWLWERSPEQAALLMADYMAQLRVHDELVDEESPLVRFDDVLRSLPLAIPARVTDAETERLIDFLRVKVPAYYGSSNLNS